MSPLSIEQRQRIAEQSVTQLGKTYAAARVTLTSPKAIPTGIPELDSTLAGVGGVPSGRICELFGPEASGKTSVALCIAANVQRSGGVVAYLDIEHRLDPQRVEALGVTIDRLLVYRPTTAEEAFDIAAALAKSGKVSLLVIDTLAGMVPRREFEAVVDWVADEDRAGLIGRAIRKLGILAARTDTCILLLNQIRTRPGVIFGNPETTPGGLAVRSHASIRIGLRKIAAIKRNGLVVGNTIKAIVVKNSLGGEGAPVEFTLHNSKYDGGADLPQLLSDARTAMQETVRHEHRGPRTGPICATA